jgi:hypothetical protein
VLAALVSIASTFPTGYSAHQGRVAARDPTKARSPPLTPVNVLRNVPRAAEVKPSNKPDRRRGEPAYVPRAAEVKPSNKPDRRRVEPAYVRRAAETKPSNKPDRRRDEPAYVRRAVQNAFGGNWFGGGLLGWLDEDQCPEPLFACPVRGARDPDAFECVDLESDLYSCGGCAADDIACVFFGNP